MSPVCETASSCSAARVAVSPRSSSHYVMTRTAPSTSSSFSVETTAAGVEVILPRRSRRAAKSVVLVQVLRHRGTQCGRNYRAVRRVVYRCSSVSSACGAHRPEDEGGTALTERTAGRRSARSRFRRDCSRRTRSDASRRPFVVEVAGRRRSSRQKVPTYGAGSAVVRRRARASVRVPGGAYCCGMPPQKFCCGGTNCCGMNGCCGGWPNWPGG